eukprot:8709001-Alexandrium_andersonii.AAC.1
MAVRKGSAFNGARPSSQSLTLAGLDPCLSSRSRESTAIISLSRNWGRTWTTARGEQKPSRCKAGLDCAVPNA